MTDIQAAIGRCQLRAYPSNLLRRKEIASRYIEALSDRDWCDLPILEDAHRETAYHLFSFRIQGFTSTKRDSLMQLLKQDGIATNVHFIPLPLLSLHRNRGEEMSDYPESMACFEEQLSLPIHLQLQNEDVDWIALRLNVHIENLLATKA